MSARDHLAANTTKQPDGCWLWTGSVLPGGYGVTNYEGKRFYVPVVALVVAPVVCIVCVWLAGVAFDRWSER